MKLDDLLTEFVTEYMKDAVRTGTWQDSFDHAMETVTDSDCGRLSDADTMELAELYFSQHMETRELPSAVNSVKNLIDVWATEGLAHAVSAAIEDAFTDLEMSLGEDVRELSFTTAERPSELSDEPCVRGDDGTWFVFGDDEDSEPTNAWREIELAPGVKAWFENSYWCYDVTGLDLLARELGAA